MIILTLQNYGPDTKRPIGDQIIKKIALGDMNAFQTLYESTSKNIYGFALSITRNKHDAEDILQETFLKVYTKAADYIGIGKPMAWILTIARNLALSKLRENGKAFDLDENRDSVLGLTTVENAEHRILLETVFNSLTLEEKQIVYLHAASGLKHREIAEMLNISLGTVLSKYNRAIKKIKLTVKEETI